MTRSLAAILMCLLCAGEATADALRTKATGKGATGTGKGALVVRLNTDDTTGRLRSTELVLETECAFAAGTKRKVEVQSSTVEDLESGRICQIVRSWLCMTMTKVAAEEANLVLDGRVELEPAGFLVIVDRELALPLKGKLKKLGSTALGTESSGVTSGSLAKGFSVQSDDGWSAKTNARAMCLANGIDRFFAKHDPALDGR